MNIWIVLVLLGVCGLICLWLVLLNRKKQKEIDSGIFHLKEDAAAEIAEKKKELAFLEEHKKKRESEIEEAFRREMNEANERLAEKYEAGLKELALRIEVEKQNTEKVKEELSRKLRLYEADVEKKRKEFLDTIGALDGEIDDAKHKYRATIQAILEKEEKETFNRLLVPRPDIEDIVVLEEKVLPLLHSPEPIRKLIWTLYIQKPTGELLNRMLAAKDVSGIYKITSLKNKKCYIGRSVNVRNRLQEHIKSAIGVGTIADQRIHSVMREEGLWNFTFELVEEVEKDKLSAREKYYIAFFESDKNLGYNQTGGG